MGTQTLPDGSCFSCSDSPLSITANITGILTFIYAVAVGLLFFYKSARESPRQLEALTRSLHSSYSEMEDFARSLSGIGSRLYGPEARSFTTDIETIKTRIADQMESLLEMTEKIDLTYHVSRGKQWRSRVRFVAIQEEFQKKVAEKDRLMDEIRRIQNK